MSHAYGQSKCKSASQLTGHTHHPLRASKILMDRQAEHLARTRRNQQRCRERKRAHVAELEGRVEALQNKIQKCEPCASPHPHEQESALGTAVRENSARRELLQALGLDDKTQQRFIESASKRQAVLAIIHEDGDHLFSPPDWTAKSSRAPSSSQVQKPLKLLADSEDLGIGDANDIEHFDSNADLLGAAVDWQANGQPPTVRERLRHSRHTIANADQIEDDWLFSPDTLNNLPPPLNDPFDVESWRMGPFNDQGRFARIRDTDVAPRDSAAAPGILPISSTIDVDSNLDPNPFTNNGTQTAANQSIERCFMDTVMHFEPSETSTVCSKVLPLVFRHNRKGLTMAELQQRLEPGMRSATGGCGECRVDDNVLFKVLAEISV